MRLIEILILNHLGTKKQVKKLLKKGHIMIDGEIVYEDCEIHDEQVYYDTALLDNHPLKYYVIHKPAGYVCANQDKKDPCLISLLPDEDLHYVGRLDRDTTGLVILTNDLKLRKRLTLPQFSIPRSYSFTCALPLTDLSPFKEGIVIDGHVKCRPALVKMEDTQKGIITLEEGKYHEIKKMFLSLNNRILSLHRIMYGGIELGDLRYGSYRPLTEDEIDHLKMITGGKYACNKRN